MLVNTLSSSSFCVIIRLSDVMIWSPFGFSIMATRRPTVKTSKTANSLWSLEDQLDLSEGTR